MRLKFFFPLVVAAMGIFMISSSANADILASDDFSYADGNLVGNGGWTNHSGSGSFIQVAGGAATLSHGGGSREDAGLNFADVSTGILTAEFDIVVTDDVTPLSGTDFEYFAHFMSEGSFNFRSRLDLVSPTGSGDYTLGIANNDSTADTVLGTDFSFGDTVAVQIAFNLDTGIASLTAGGATAIGDLGDASLGETLNRFALRQSESSASESIQVDNLVISRTVPEPTSAIVLAAFAGLGVVRRRK